MASFLRSIFKLHPGEERKTGMLFLLGFLWSLGASCGNILMDALYVAYVGADQLPYVFFATAGVMFSLTVVFLKALNRTSIYKIYRFILALTAVGYLIAYILLSFGVANYYYWFILKVFSYIAFAKLLTCYWTFIDQYFGLQEAKRLFNIFNSAVFLGVAVSGGLMSLSYFTPVRLFLFIFCCISTSLVFVHFSASRMRYIHYYEDEDEFSSEVSLKDLVIIILKSRFTLYLLALNMFTEVLEIITEYQYMAEFENYFISIYGIEEFHRPLTQFIGKVTAGVSVVNILFGFIIYSRLIAKIGIKNLAFIIPVMFLALYTGWIKVNYLFFPVFGYAIVEGFLYTVADNNFTLLLNAAPQKVKNKIRVVFEFFFEPIGMFLSSVFLLFSKAYAKPAGLVMTLFLLLIAFSIRRKYFKAILGQLVSKYNKKEEVPSDHGQRLLDIKSNSEIFYQTETVEQLHLLLSTENKNIALHASAVLALLKKDSNDTIANKHLVSMLHSPLAEEICMALEVVLMGEVDVFDELLSLESIVYKEELSYDVRFLALTILYDLNPANFKAKLFDLLSPELKRAERYHCFSNKFQVVEESAVLKEALKDILTFVIKTVALNGDIKNCTILAETVLHRNPKTYGIGLEILEKITPEDVYGRLLPLIYKIHHKTLMNQEAGIEEEAFKKDILSSEAFIDVMVSERLNNTL